MKIAMIAPPWLSIPPHGYGGIEVVLDALVPALAALGAEVHLYTVGRTWPQPPPGVRVHVLDDREQYSAISGTLYDTMSVPAAHVTRALGRIAGRGFDVIHDHNAFIGPAACANLDPGRFPPALHTLHGPFTDHADIRRGLPDNRDSFRAFERSERVWFNGISRSQVRDVPAQLRARLLGVVHNGLAPNAMPAPAHGSPDQHERGERDGYFLTLARVCEAKGQGLAARICSDLGERLVIAGAVDGVGDPATVLRDATSMSGGAARHADLDYFARQVAPYLRDGSIEYVGDQAGAQKLQLLVNARALLFPIDWEEPFGMAVVEALAAGTPVVAMRRGAMPELIEHGVTGFLADTPEEFAQYVRRVDALDRARCRASVERRFSAHAMASGYLQLYEQAIARDVEQRHGGRRMTRRATLTSSRLDDLHRTIRHGDLPRRVEHLDPANA